ncbi:helix-turn-helix transcriptional regulator [Deinococcus sp. HMF7604]|uniref:helix-turn-helix domain-containing protein n=1 Tax=Deinococcus betulae TaxID=2873312 RepID=UPI001CCC1595|nr:helix-turn-helix transcriptional regulator [Deinococcus betulae]
MNEEIRAKVDARLREKGLSRADLARATGKTPQAITRALNGGKDSGSAPPVWAAILEALDLHLTVEPEKGESKKANS